MNHSGYLPSNVSDKDENSTAELQPAVYVFTPAGYEAKVGLCFMFSAIVVMGLLGNASLLLYLLRKPMNRRDRIYSSRFMKNLNLTLRNLALSGFLASLCLTLTCIQVLFDVFQSGWSCKIVRYFSFVFVFIAINIMVVINLEKYLSTRRIPRSLSASTVAKMMNTAWIFGVIAALVPSSTYEGQRIDLNQSHFTVVCRYQPHLYPIPALYILIPIQCVAPYLFITFSNVSLVKTMWNRTRKTQACHTANNPLKAKLSLIRIRGLTLLVTITVTNLITTFFFVAFLVYNRIAEPSLDFSTSYVLRYASGFISHLNSSSNVVVYFAQMKDFRKFLKMLLCPRDKIAHNDIVLTGKRPKTQASIVQPQPIKSYESRI